MHWAARHDCRPQWAAFAAIGVASVCFSDLSQARVVELADGQAVVDVSHDFTAFEDKAATITLDTYFSDAM